MKKNFRITFGNKDYYKIRLASTNSVNKLYLIKPITSYTNCDREKINIFKTAKIYANKGVIYCLNKLKKI